jgi:hypothetical protein
MATMKAGHTHPCVCGNPNGAVSCLNVTVDGKALWSWTDGNGKVHQSVVVCDDVSAKLPFCVKCDMKRSMALRYFAVPPEEPIHRTGQSWPSFTGVGRYCNALMVRLKLAQTADLCGICEVAFFDPLGECIVCQSTREPRKKTCVWCKPPSRRRSIMDQYGLAPPLTPPEPAKAVTIIARAKFPMCPSCISQVPCGCNSCRGIVDPRKIFWRDVALWETAGKKREVKW